MDGDGQSAFCEFHQLVASLLNKQGIATCLKALRKVEQLPTARDSSEYGRFDFETLGKISHSVFNLLHQDKRFSNLNFCLFATGDAASATLYMTATRPAELSAIVISGGRPAQALPLAAKNTVPTLFIVGSEDRIGSQACQSAFAASRGPKELSIIENAGHLLREPGALEEVARRSAEWFQQYSR